VIDEFGLDPSDLAGLDEWLDLAERGAVEAHPEEPTLYPSERPDEWDGLRERAIEVLAGA